MYLYNAKELNNLWQLSVVKATLGFRNNGIPPGDLQTDRCTFKNFVFCNIIS